MAKTVNQAFDEFMKNSVNLDKDIVEKARASRDNLLAEIAKFSGDNGFFVLHSPFNYQFGSFARKTKCRPLDDIDLMIGISAEGNTYDGASVYDNVKMCPSECSIMQKECSDFISYDNYRLNSTKLMNVFKQKLEKLPEYQHSVLSRNGEAITLNLVSKEWSFDIVPCFFTKKDARGRTYYLIPNGKGDWKKTDPRIDRDRADHIRNRFGNIAMDAIRLFKYWNNYAHIKTIPGYIAECLLMDYFEGIDVLNMDIKYIFRNILDYVRDHIFSVINDPKELEGNINILTNTECVSIWDKINMVICKIDNALQAESQYYTKTAINIWRDIFGDEFPLYD